MYKKLNTDGFIATTFVLIMAALILAIGLTMSITSYSEMIMSKNERDGENSILISESCLDAGIQELKSDPLYSGNETIELGGPDNNKINCKIMPVETVNGFTKKISINVSLIDDDRLNRSLEAEVSSHKFISNLSAHWPMDERIGNHITDKSGNGNSGYSRGPFLKFSGDDRVAVNHTSELNNPFPISLSCWIRPDTVSKEYQHCIGKTENSTSTTYAIGISEDNLEFRWGDEEEWMKFTPDNVILLSTWQHIAATFNGSEVKLYLDGNEIYNTTTSRSGVGNNVPLGIGSSRGDANEDTFVGYLDDIRIYNRILSSEEISSLYQREDISNDNIAGHWIFNEGSGCIAKDVSGRENNGTFGPNCPASSPDWIDWSPKWTKGRFNEAMEFNGVNSYVEAVVSQTKTSFSLWIQSSGGLWEHVVKSGSTYYVNGAVGSPSAFPIHISGDTVQIGKTGASAYFNGKIDDVRIYDRELLKEEIEFLFLKGKDFYIKR